jgi:hypothetical protein
MPPRTTQKSYRLRASNRIMVGTLRPKLLVAFPRSTTPAFLFPPSPWFPNGPRRQGLLRHSPRRVPAPLAVPLTDSGPFGTTLPARREKELKNEPANGLPLVGQCAEWSFRDGKHALPQPYEAGGAECHANPRNGFSSIGEIFLLTFPFIE